MCALDATEATVVQHSAPLREHVDRPSTIRPATQTLAGKFFFNFSKNSFLWRREQYYTWKVEQCLMRHWLPTLMNMFTTSAGGGAVRSGTFVSERRVSMTFRSMTFREFLCCMILKGVGGVGDYANNSLSFLFALPLSENGNQSLSFIHFVECVARIADRWHKSLFYNQENQEEDQEKDQEEDQEEEKTKMKTKVTLDLKIDMFMTYLKASQVKQ